MNVSIQKASSLGDFGEHGLTKEVTASAKVLVFILISTLQ